MPSNGSRATRNGPSRSAQSTSGERWAAAVERIALSTMQPSMIFKPSARAVWIIASAPPFGCPGRDRLFAELDVVAAELAQQRDRTLGRPAFVGVDPDRPAVDVPD